MEKQILLVKSDSMSNNKKEGRRENALLRASAVTRDNLKFETNKCTTISSYEDGTDVELSPFKAFSKDIKQAHMLCDKGVIDKKDLSKVCFVTSKSFNKFTNDENQEVVKVLINKTFNEMLIGTDPELLIMQKGEVVKANDIPGFTKHAKFGSDGAMAELRPDPSYTPEGLVKNIRILLSDKEMTKNIQNYDWMSACYFENKNRDFPVGTHLHFDNPIKIKALTLERRTRLFAVTNRILDELLTIPMIRLDGQLGHNRRAKCKMSQVMGYGNNYGTGYGFFGEWRICNGRLEHRSLSGLVIADPDICRDVFGVGQAIVEAIYREVLKCDLDPEFILPEKFTAKGVYNKEFKDWTKVPLTEVFGCTNSSEFMKTVMDNSSRVDISKNYISKWLNKLRKISTYGKYENYVESLGELLNSSAKTLDGLNKNIKQNWGI